LEEDTNTLENQEESAEYVQPDPPLSIMHFTGLITIIIDSANLSQSDAVAHPTARAAKAFFDSLRGQISVLDFSHFKKSKNWTLSSKKLYKHDNDRVLIKRTFENIICDGQIKVYATIDCFLKDDNEGPSKITFRISHADSYIFENSSLSIDLE
jgi:hypothetical protein